MACQCTTCDPADRFLSRLVALSVAFRYPSRCVVLGSLPSVKVSELRETRTVLLGLAHVQRRRIPSAVSSTASLRLHLVFSRPSIPPSVSSVAEQFCISTMGPAAALSDSSFCRMLPHRIKTPFPSPAAASCFLVPLAMVEVRWGQWWSSGGASDGIYVANALPPGQV